MLRFLQLIICAALLMPSAMPASAADDDVAAFYKGKTVRVVNAFGQGGQYSNLARLISVHLPRHIPGQPSGVVQFMPGAGGLLQTNYLYNVAPKDGSVIGLMYDNTPASQLLEPENVKFDARHFHALGFSQQRRERADQHPEADRHRDARRCKA